MHLRLMAASQQGYRNFPISTFMQSTVENCNGVPNAEPSQQEVSVIQSFNLTRVTRWLDYFAVWFNNHLPNSVKIGQSSFKISPSTKFSQNCHRLCPICQIWFCCSLRTQALRLVQTCVIRCVKRSR